MSAPNVSALRELLETLSRSLFRRRADERDLDDELPFHIESKRVGSRPPGSRRTTPCGRPPSTSEESCA
jgi:hypothetical protein